MIFLPRAFLPLTSFEPWLAIFFNGFGFGFFAFFICSGIVTIRTESLTTMKILKKKWSFQVISSCKQLAWMALNERIWRIFAWKSGHTYCPNWAKCKILNNWFSSLHVSRQPFLVRSFRFKKRKSFQSFRKYRVSNFQSSIESIVFYADPDLLKYSPCPAIASVAVLAPKPGPWSYAFLAWYLA